jgi:hypothetical protein
LLPKCHNIFKKYLEKPKPRKISIEGKQRKGTKSARGPIIIKIEDLKDIQKLAVTIVCQARKYLSL